MFLPPFFKEIDFLKEKGLLEGNQAFCDWKLKTVFNAVKWWNSFSRQTVDPLLPLFRIFDFFQYMSIYSFLTLFRPTCELSIGILWRFGASFLESLPQNDYWTYCIHLVVHRIPVALRIVWVSGNECFRYFLPVIFPTVLICDFLLYSVSCGLEEIIQAFQIIFSRRCCIGSTSYSILVIQIVEAAMVYVGYKPMLWWLLLFWILCVTVARFCQPRS